MEEVYEQLRQGKMILVHDSSGREDEVDMVVPSDAVRPKTIRTLRKDGGGLICLSISSEIAKKLRLPFMADLLESDPNLKGLVPEKTKYGDKPAFSVSVNHRQTFTGVTDADRALTISEFSKMKSKQMLDMNYYCPGHVHLLISRGIENRRGHTELSVELASRADIYEAMVLCEMMGDDDNALGVDEARQYAERNGLLFVDGCDI